MATCLAMSVIVLDPDLILAVHRVHTVAFSIFQVWQSDVLEKVYTVLLDVVLLVLPLGVITGAYCRVSYTLWRGAVGAAVCADGRTTSSAEGARKLLVNLFTFPAIFISQKLTIFFPLIGLVSLFLFVC